MVLLLTCTSLLPNPLAAPVQTLALLGALVGWLANPDGRRGRFQVGLVIVATSYFLVLLAHPNVPSLHVGILGVRKSTWALWGLVLGASVSGSRVAAAWRWTVASLWVAVAASVALFLLAPALAQNIAGSEKANVYTGLIDGEIRMHGIFAGPFHAALAGIVLIGAGVAIWGSKKWLAVLVVAMGLVGTYLTLVRTAYVAIGLMVGALILVSPSVGSFMRRLMMSVSAAVIGVVAVAITRPAALSTVESISGAASDDRFLNRVPGWIEGLAMFSQSPIIGWGPGAAGDVMGEYFIGLHRHINAHNLLLKYAVEGGLIAVLLVALLSISLIRAIDPSTPTGMSALLAFVGLLGLGLTVSSVEALPVSYLVFVLVGLALPGQRQASPGVGAGSTEIGRRDSLTDPGSARRPASLGPVVSGRPVGGRRSVVS
ncbi:O-antigen ligase family protein [Nocardioides sp. AN3]